MWAAHFVSPLYLQATRKIIDIQRSSRTTLFAVGLDVPEDKKGGSRLLSCRRCSSKLERQFGSDLDLTLGQQGITRCLDHPKLRICHERRCRGSSADGEVSSTH